MTRTQVNLRTSLPLFLYFKIDHDFACVTRPSLDYEVNACIYDDTLTNTLIIPE